MQPFSEQYRPQTTQDMHGEKPLIEFVRTFILTYAKQKKKGILLHGAPGVGKTSLALALAREHNFELVEINASDVRNKEAIERVLGAAMQQQSLFQTKKLFLIDEVDGLSGTKDRGGNTALVDILKKSTYPIILTANDGWNEKLSTIRKYCEVKEIPPPKYTTIYSILKDICHKEGIQYDETALKTLARRAGGDMRAAITDLESLSAQQKKITAEELAFLGERRKAETLFTALQRIFKGRDPQLAKEAIDAVDEPIDEVFLWVDENVPKEYTKPEDCARAYDALSRADVFRGRILRWQHWRYLVYVIDEMTAGVCLAKQERYSGFTKYSRSMRPLTYWRASSTRQKKKAIAQHIAVQTKQSTKQVLGQLAYYAHMLSDKTTFELTGEEQDWLRKTYQA